jgi:hypothetical protein
MVYAMVMERRLFPMGPVMLVSTRMAIGMAQVFYTILAATNFTAASGMMTIDKERAICSLINMKDLHGRELMKATFTVANSAVWDCILTPMEQALKVNG